MVTRRAHVQKRGEDGTGFDTVLVPLDGSEFAERALLYVDRLKRIDAEVILLRAVASASQLAASAGAAPVPGMSTSSSCRRTAAARPRRTSMPWPRGCGSGVCGAD